MPHKIAPPDRSQIDPGSGTGSQCVGSDEFGSDGSDDPSEVVGHVVVVGHHDPDGSFWPWEVDEVRPDPPVSHCVEPELLDESEPLWSQELESCDPDCGHWKSARALLVHAAAHNPRMAHAAHAQRTRCLPM